MNVLQIEQGNSAYPAVLIDRLGDAAPPCLHAMGDTTILCNSLLGLACSIQCPGSIVIQTFDAIRALRDAGVAVIGGFHSPMERECLDLLLRGEQPVVMCAARGLPGLRIGQDARRAISDGRMLVLSPFDNSIRRTIAAQAVLRNGLVTALADAVWVPHAVPGGKTWATVLASVERGQPVFTFFDENSEILQAGAQPFGELLKIAIKRCQKRAGGTAQLIEELLTMSKEMLEANGRSWKKE